MADIDAVTGQPLTGFDEVVQSLGKIFSTRIGERVMRRWFGGVGAQLLGRLMTPRSILIFRTAVAVSIDLYEPRFKVGRIRLDGNTTEEIRLGRLTMVIEGTYRPRAHLGDFRAEQVRFLRLAIDRSGFQVAAQG
jgi:uncharacterized protein